MKKKPTLSFCLSQEELFVSFHYLNNSMAGVNVDVLDELSEKEKSLILGVAERALIARGILVGMNNHRLQLSTPFFACLDTCAGPERSILIKNTLANGPEEEYHFHVSRKMRVIHTIPMTAIHQFIAVEDDLAFNKAILSTVKVANFPKIDFKGVEIEMKILFEAREFALRGDVKSAEALLKQYFLDSSSIVFANALASPVSNTTVALVDKSRGINDGFTIFQSKEHLWQMSPVDSGGLKNIVLLSSVDSKSVIEKVTAMVSKQ